jgi:hypothetical protein
MNTHQRRIFTQMLDQIDLYGAGRITLDRLVMNLGGLLGAADLHDNDVVNAFYIHLAPIQRQIELQDWAPHKPISWPELDAAVQRYRAWAIAMLDDPSEELL